MRRWVPFAVLALGVALGMAASWAQPVEVENVRNATYDAASETWTLHGEPVRIRRADLLLEARRVVYRAAQGTFEAAGGVRVVQGDEGELRAEEATGSLVQRRVEFGPDVRATYRTAQGPVMLEAPVARADFLRRVMTASGGVRLTWQNVTLQALEVSFDGTSERASARGSPQVTWEDLQLRAGALDADLRTRVLWASGGVRLDHPSGWIVSQQAEVRWQDRLAILRGEVTAQRGSDRMRAEEVRYAWERGMVQADGGVRVVVYP